MIDFIHLHPLTGTLSSVLRIVIHYQPMALGISSANEL